MRDFKEESKMHSETLGFDLSSIEQGSPEWHKSRAGCITASNAHKILMDDKRAPFPVDLKIETISRGKNFVELGDEFFEGTKVDCQNWVRDRLPKVIPDTKLAYMYSLAAQVCTGSIPEEIRAKSLQWGKDNEEDARDAYSAATFEIIQEVPFIYRDNSMRCGCSPDGLIEGAPKGVELKCPMDSGVFIAFATADKIKPEYYDQCQFSMWVTDFESWSFANFDPRMTNAKKLHYVTVERDDSRIKKIEVAQKEFIERLDEVLDKMGVQFGQQWEGS